MSETGTLGIDVRRRRGIKNQDQPHMGGGKRKRKVTISAAANKGSERRLGNREKTLFNLRRIRRSCASNALQRPPIILPWKGYRGGPKRPDRSRDQAAQSAETATRWGRRRPKGNGFWQQEEGWGVEGTAATQRSGFTASAGRGEKMAEAMKLENPKKHGNIS